ncbi:MAG: hypothetical protein ACP5H3_03000 [Candidatus Aenigmatarchaeota archaeon]
MVRIEPTIYCKKFDVILTKKDLKQVKRKNAKKKLYWTTKKENDSCIFLKNGKCSLKQNAPLLCKAFPIFFKVDKKEGLITWLILHKKRISCKNLEEKKKIIFDFLKEASRKELKHYFTLLKFLKLRELEEDILPKEILKIVKKKL